ncbi:ash family protein [Pectobacterium brasiliense]|nr:ash family protein [Pectobacterium brasiliense]
MALSFTRTCKIRCRDWSPEILHRRHRTRPRLFLCRTHGYISMVGWAGAPQGAPVSDEAGKTNSVQSTTRKIGLFGGGDISTHRRLPYGYDHYPHSPITDRFF